MIVHLKLDVYKRQAVDEAPPYIGIERNAGEQSLFFVNLRFHRERLRRNIWSYGPHFGLPRFQKYFI